MQLVLAEYLWLGHLQGTWSAESVGLRFDAPTSVANALVLGIAAYLALGALFTGAAVLLGMHEALRRARLRANASLWPRARGAKIVASAAIRLLNPAG